MGEYDDFLGRFRNNNGQWRQKNANTKIDVIPRDNVYSLFGPGSKVDLGLVRAKYGKSYGELVNLPEQKTTKLEWSTADDIKYRLKRWL